MPDQHPQPGRRKALTCMLWAGSGLVWTVAGGVPRSALLGSAAAQPAGGFRFVQISDSHLGFKAAPNPDPTTTLAEGLALAKAEAPAFMLHTGDVTHLSREGQFDLAQQMIKGTGLETRFVPGEHDVAGDDGAAYYARLPEGREHGGAYSFDAGGVHFIGLNNVMDLKPGKMGMLGAAQLEFLARDLQGQSASTPIVVFSHIPLWVVYESWGWGTEDGAQALSLMRRFGSVTVLNGHIHQTLQKVEGNLAFHSGRSLAFPQSPPGQGTPGPIKDLPAGQLRSTLGVNRVTLVRGDAPLAVVTTPLGT
ncbi:MAG TPA: metallophosphoesterase [Crenalkalicoccus sp.]|nr:metallophosphoesterase [Crenalkalicoccus sp.]